MVPQVVLGLAHGIRCTDVVKALGDLERGDSVVCDETLEYLAQVECLTARPSVPRETVEGEHPVVDVLGAAWRRVLGVCDNADRC